MPRLICRPSCQVSVSPLLQFPIIGSAQNSTSSSAFLAVHVPKLAWSQLVRYKLAETHSDEGAWVPSISVPIEGLQLCTPPDNGMKPQRQAR